jgi:hypothetical protein
VFTFKLQAMAFGSLIDKFVSDNSLSGNGNFFCCDEATLAANFRLETWLSSPATGRLGGRIWTDASEKWA